MPFPDICPEVVFSTNPQFSNNHTFVTKSPNVIIEEIDTLKQLFEPNILNQASDICLTYQKSKTSNVNVRNNLMVHCLYESYNKSGYTVPIEFIYDRLGLDKKQKRIKRSSKNFNWGVQIISPESLVPFYVDRIRTFFVVLEKSIDRAETISKVCLLLDECSKTPNGQTWRDNKPANPITVAALYYYLNTVLKIDIQVKQFAEICYISNVCLNEYLKNLIKHCNP